MSEQRKQLDEMAAAQAEREKALHQAEEALKQVADAQRRRARIRNIAFVVVSIFAALTAWLYWNAEQQRKVAEEQRAVAEVQRRQADDLLTGTAEALTNVAWHALFAREFTKALTVADRAHAFLPDDLTIETNRAHALMFLEREKEAKALYFTHKGKPLSEENAKLWERAIAEDFAEFRKAGLTHPMMAEIEKELGVFAQHHRKTYIGQLFSEK